MTDENGCPGSAQTLIIVDANVPVFIPNAFSPTIKDGNNDRFTVLGKPGVVEEVVSMAIFDRWGNQVFGRNNFPPNDPSMGWDGTRMGRSLNSAVFVYFIRLRLIDGTEAMYEGEIVLVE